MGVLHQYLLLRRTVNDLFVLVGQGAALHIQRMTKVHRVSQNGSYSSSRPCVGPCGVQPRAGHASLLIVLVGGVQHMVIPQYTGDLIRPFPLGAELEDALNDALCLLIGDEPLAVTVPLAVAVGRLTA